MLSTIKTMILKIVVLDSEFFFSFVSTYRLLLFELMSDDFQLVCHLTDIFPNQNSEFHF